MPVDRRALTFLCALAACGRRDESAHERVAAILTAAEARQHANAAELDLAERELDEMAAQAGRLVDGYRAAEATYQRAAEMFQRAEGQWRVATTEAAAAREDYERARDGYHRAIALMLAGATNDLSAQFCREAISTSAYRRQLREAGVDLTGRDIDHVFPHAQGGANHPLNYRPLDASTNRALGARILPKVAAMPGAVLQGLLVSALMRLRCAGNPRAFGR